MTVALTPSIRLSFFSIRAAQDAQVGLLLLPSAGLAVAMPRIAGALLTRIGPPASLALSGVVASGALVLAAVGTWQLSRLGERRARNAAVAARLTQAPTTRDRLPADTAARHYRRVRVVGRPLYDREFVLVNRTREGSPGVHIVTPVQVAGADTLVLLPAMAGG